MAAARDVESCLTGESTSTASPAPVAGSRYHVRPSAESTSTGTEAGAEAAPPDLTGGAPPPAAQLPCGCVEAASPAAAQTPPTTTPETPLPDAPHAATSKERGEVRASLQRLDSGGSSVLLSMPCSDAPEDGFGSFVALALSELQRSVLAEHERVVRAIARGGTSPELDSGGRVPLRRISSCSIEEAPLDPRRMSSASAHVARAASDDGLARVSEAPRGLSSLQGRRYSGRGSHLKVVVPTAAESRTTPPNSDGLRLSSGDVHACSDARPRRSTCGALGMYKSDSPRRSPRDAASQERRRRRREEKHGSHGSGRSLTGQRAPLPRPAASQMQEPVTSDPDDHEEGNASGRSGGGRAVRRHQRRTLTSSSAFSGVSEGSVLGTKQQQASAEAEADVQHAPSGSHDGEFALLDVWEKAKNDGVLRAASFWCRRTLGTGSTSPGRLAHHHRQSLTDATTGHHEAKAQGAEMSPWRLRWWVMPPNSRRRLAWDALSMLCILYDLVMAPLEFLNEQYSAPSPMHWVIMLFWTFDILASCTSGYTLPNGTEVYDLRLIWRRYAVSWLLLDAVMVGADWMEALLHNELPTGWRLLRMMRLLRLLRLKRFLSLLIMRMQSERAALVFGIAQTLLAILFLAHAMGCMWAGLGMSEGAQGWVSHAADGGELTGEQTYLLAMHWALTNFAGTVNLGPRSWKERVYAIVSLVFGFLVASAFVSIITSNMTRLSMLASRRAGEFKDLNTYLHERGISRSLKSRVLLNAQHAIAEQEAHIPEESVKLLEDVSEPLRRELHFEIYADHLSVHPLFDLLRSKSSGIMKRICHEAVVPVLVSENETIFSEDEVPSEPPQMIFVEKGLLKYQLDDEAVQDVSPGQWISEQVLWTNWVYQGTLWSVTPCRLLMLNSLVFQQILSTKVLQGTLNVGVTEYATEFLRELNESRHRVCSDLGSQEASARLARQISGTNLQDPGAEAPRRHSGGSLQESIRDFHTWLGGARSPDQPGSRSESRHTSRESRSPSRARFPWLHRRDAPVAPAHPAPRSSAPPLTDLFARATSAP